MVEHRPIIGIVGGLCPLATADIYFKAMRQVKAQTGDPDYPDIIVSAAPEQIERGTRFDASPMHAYDMTHRMLYIYQVAKQLAQLGAEKILVPDFLSYSFAKTIGENIGTPLLDIVAALISAIRRHWPNAARIGILTTSWAIEKKIFEAKFAAAGLVAIYPDPEIQARTVMEAIYGDYGVKRGFTDNKPGHLISAACRHLLDKGADIIVSAVTELPLIERRYYPEANYLDGNEAIATALLETSPQTPAGPTAPHPCAVGVLGGLGPAATVDLFDKIVKNTPAGRDQEHIKLIIENNPQIPDRTAALEGQGENPAVALLATAEKLQQAGASFIIVPCNTAHVFLKDIQAHLKIPIISMIEETAAYLAEKLPHVRTAGLLATSGTVKSRVYEAPLKARGIALITPDPQTQQECVMEAIYGAEGIKAGHVSGKPRRLLQQAAQQLLKNGAEAIIMGCTEIPLALKPDDIGIPVIDPTEILARAAIRRAQASQKP